MRRAVLIAVPTAILAAVLLVPAVTTGDHCGECRADLSISGHAEPQPIRKGDKSTLKITPKNDGPDGTHNVEVHVNVPFGLKILSTEVHGGHGCSVDGTFVDCEMGWFASQQLGVIKIKVRGREKGTFVSKAEVFGHSINDPNGGNGQVGITVGVKGKNG